MENVRLVVFVDGGLVQEIFSNVPAEVLIIDQDVEGCEEVRAIKEWDFKKEVSTEETFEVFDKDPWNVHVVPAGVDHYFNEMKRESEVKPDAKMP